jgi:hypothetical protein
MFSCYIPGLRPATTLKKPHATSRHPLYPIFSKDNYRNQKTIEGG